MVFFMTNLHEGVSVFAKVGGFLKKLFKNEDDLVYFLLQSLIECIPERHLDAVAVQVDGCIDVEWVGADEVVFGYDDDDYCRERLIDEWKERRMIAKIEAVGPDGRSIKLEVWVAEGRLWSIKGDGAFRGLKETDLFDLRVVCVGEGSK